VNCWLTPFGKERLSGATEIPRRTAGVTESVADPETELELAVIVVVPRVALTAAPLAPIVATAGVEDIHDTEVVMILVLPSVYVPVAMNCWEVPRAMEADNGETAMDTSVALVTVSAAGALVKPW
jgi:hypothetical protein